MLGTIRWKIILYSVVPVTLFYNLIFCIYFYLTYEDIKSDIEARIQNEVIILSRALDSEVRSIVYLADVLTKKYESITASSRDLNLDAISGTEILLNPLISGVFLYELQKKKRRVGGSGYYLKGGDALQWNGYLEERSVIRNALGNRTSDPKKDIWTHLYFDELTSCQTVSFLRPLMINAELWGYFCLYLNMHELLKKVIDRHSFAGEYMQINLCQFNLIDRKGFYLYSEDEKSFKQGYLNINQTGDPEKNQGYVGNVNQLINSQQPEQQVVCSADSGDSREYWFFAAPIKPSEWWLYTYISRDRALSLGYSTIISNALILIISLLVITLCSWYASLKITQPVLALKKAMDLFTYKNRMPDRVLKSRDEIGSLTESFQQLVEKLKERDKALHELRTNNIGHLVQKLGGTYFYFNLDNDGYVTHVSPSVEAILGYEPREFCRAFVSFISGEENRERFGGQLASVLSCSHSDTFEVDLHHKLGGVRKVEIFWSNMGCSGEKYRVIEAMANDVTERASDTEKFKSLLNAGPDAMIIATIEGVVSLVNSRAQMLFGFDHAELVNMPLRILIPDEQRTDNPLLEGLRVSTWEELRLDGVESQGIDANGRLFPIEITSNPLATAEGLLISIVIRDITSRKKIESELRQAKEEAEKASMAKGMFLSNMSHELRTPLNCVLGYTQILLRDDDIPVRHRRNIQAIESSGHHLLSLINDILDLTKIESGEVELHMYPCRLRQLLQDVHDIMAERALNKGLALELVLCESLPVCIITDEIKVRQILLNLLSNAVKYTFKGSVQLLVDCSDNVLQFTTKDSGVGIASEDLEYVFEPFRQSHQGLEAGGTGLGLAISRWLVASMGGELSVKSYKGKGSAFTFGLPFQEAQPSLAGQVEHKLSGCHKLALEEQSPLFALIVDDIASNRDMLADLLSSVGGLRTDKVINGLEALNAIASNRYDLVLMDIKMPVLNGLEAMRRLRGMESGKSLPVIAVTASVSTEKQQQLLEEGFSGYIGKPFDANELFGLISQVLNIPLVENTRQPWEGQYDQVTRLGLTKRKELSGILLEALEQGDLDLLEKRIESLDKDEELMPLTDFIINLCREMDLDGLEKLQSELNKSLPS